MVTVTRLARERRHTLRFLEYARSFSPVFLDTEVDMTRVAAHRAGSSRPDGRYSWVTYVLHSAARVLMKYPQANAAVSGRWRPRLAKYDAVHAKLALDKVLAGNRVVLSAILPNADTATLDELQERIDYFRTGDPTRLPELAGTRTLHRLPWPVGSFAFRAAVRPLRKRQQLMGSLAVTSLGHSAVDGFHSVGGTTITLGIGRIVERPVVRDGEVTASSVMRLNLTFDHRVIDGAEAADLLTDIKESLERWDE